MLTRFLILGAIMAASLPADALAATGGEGLFPVPDSDLSWSYVRTLFELDAENSAIAAMFKVFNAGVLLFSCLMLGYAVLRGLWDSAETGQVMGQNFSLAWVAARAVVGIALVAPLPSGMSGIQHVVLGASKAGIWLANQTWTAAVDTIAGKGGYLVAQPMPEVDQVIYSVMKAEMCWQSLGQHDAILQAKGRVSDSLYRVETKDGVETHIWDWGPVCGNVRIRVATDAKAETGPSKAPVTGSAPIGVGTVKEAGVDVPRTALVPDVAKAQVAAINSNLGAIKGTVTEVRTKYLKGTWGWIGSKPATPSRASVDSFGKSYKETMGKAGRAAFDRTSNKANEAFRREASELGWITAGVWMQNISRLNAVYAAEVNKLPEASDLKLALLEKEAAKVVGEDVGRLEEWWQHTKPRQVDGRVAAGDPSEWTIKRLLTVGEWEWVYSSLQLRSANPIAELSTFGHRLIWTAEASLLAVASVSGVFKGIESAAQAASNTLFGIGAPVAAPVAAFGAAMHASLEFMSPVLMLIGGGFLVVGVFFGLVVPMLPYMIWLFAVTLWFAFLCEAMVAAPLWATSHLRLEGSGLAGDAAKGGYVLVFNLLLRPAMMVFGLVLGYALINILMAFINDTFYAAIRDQQADSILGLVSLLTYCIILMVLIIGTIERCFSLTYYIADRVGAWFGADTKPLGENEDYGRARGVVGGVVSRGEAAGSAAAGDGDKGGGSGGSPTNPAAGIQTAIQKAGGINPTSILGGKRTP